MRPAPCASHTDRVLRGTLRSPQTDSPRACAISRAATHRIPHSAVTRSTNTTDAQTTPSDAIRRCVEVRRGVARGMARGMPRRCTYVVHRSRRGPSCAASVSRTRISLESESTPALTSRSSAALYASPPSSSANCASTFIFKVVAIGNRLEIDIALYRCCCSHDADGAGYERARE